MPSLNIKSELTLTTGNSRVNVSNLYKSYSVDAVQLLNPIVLGVGDIKTLDLTYSKVLIITPDTYGMENEPLELELTTSTDSLVITNLGYYMSSVFNIVSASITNVGTQPVELVVVY